jgi:hypothetical protein
MIHAIQIQWIWEEVDGEVPSYWSFTARVFWRSLVAAKVTTVFSRRG